MFDDENRLVKVIVVTISKHACCHTGIKTSTCNIYPVTSIVDISITFYDFLDQQCVVCITEKMDL